MYVFQMFDYQAGGISLVLIAFLEAEGIGWFYGEKDELIDCHLLVTVHGGASLYLSPNNAIPCT